MMACSKMQVYSLPLPTAEGEFVAFYNDNGLCGLSFPRGDKKSEAKSALAKIPEAIRRWQTQTAAALTRALAGKDPGKLPPLDLSSGTSFQQSVWQALREIACGQTLSYGQVAEVIGNPRAVRAVGGACGANPIPVFIPCHRVLAAQSRIGGFSSDPKWKRMLLEREGVLLKL
jgi:O-6-methylguanine DNA methyltransferase